MIANESRYYYELLCFIFYFIFFFRLHLLLLLFLLVSFRFVSLRARNWFDSNIRCFFHLFYFTLTSVAAVSGAASEPSYQIERHGEQQIKWNINTKFEKKHLTACAHASIVHRSRLGLCVFVFAHCALHTLAVSAQSYFARKIVAREKQSN